MLLEQAESSLLQLRLGDQNMGDRFIDHHLLYERFEQIEAIKQGATFRADRTPQIWNYSSCLLYTSDAADE